MYTDNKLYLLKLFVDGGIVNLSDLLKQVSKFEPLPRISSNDLYFLHGTW